MTTAIIQTEHLSKQYRPGLYALQDMSLTVQPGEIFGFLGPNGAGKTTTIRLLLDLIRPTSGRALLFGQEVRKESVVLRQRIGYLPGELSLWKQLTGRDVVHFFSKMRNNGDPAYLRQLCDRLQLDLSLKVRAYSSGNRRKLGLVLALMHRPELVILDEPTNGLDPLMQQVFNELMREVRSDGRTVFLSSHILGEVQAICDRVGILRSGELKTVATVTELTQVGFRWVTVQTRDTPRVEQFANVSGVSEIQVQDHQVQLRLSGDFDPLLRALNAHYIHHMQIEEPTLEEIFLGYYDQSKEGK
jgi:ABC-2 type transport system ATP-binding protein